MKYLVLVVVSLVSLSAGCAHQSRASSASGCSLQELLKATDLKMLFSDIARDLCDDGDPRRSVDKKRSAGSCSELEGARQDTVLVTDFVDINSFVPKQAGLLMGELMRGSLNNVCCHKIVQAEFAAYFKLSENGLVSLTRKSSEIRNDEYQQPEAIVGTYNYIAGNKMLIFVKKINTESSNISRMVTKEINYTCINNSVISYTIK